MIFFLVASFVTALLSGVGLTWAVRRLAVTRGWNGPSSPHHGHDGPVPRVGGIAVFGAVLISIVAGSVGFRAFSVAAAITVGKIVIAAAIVFAVGLRDDFHPIRPRFKLLSESIAAIILITAGISIDRLPIIGPLPYLVAVPLTVLCVVGITNAFNLIDGLDGLAAGTAAVSTATFLALAVHRGDTAVAWIAAGLLGAVAGFLRFNVNPATIFLGDCGSLLIGFLISIGAVTTVREAPSAHLIAVPILAIGLPVMDTLLTIIRRYLKRQPIFVPDREHIHHKLLDRGHSHRSAVWILYGLSALFGCLSIALLVWQVFAPVMLVLCCATSLIVVYLGYHKYLRESRFAPHPAAHDLAAARASFQQVTSRLKYVQTFPELWRTLSRLLNGRITGYDLSIPAPVAGVDLRDWGFLLDDTGKQYVWHHHGSHENGHNGNGHHGNGHHGNGTGAHGHAGVGHEHEKNCYSGNGNGNGAGFLTVELPACKKQAGNVLRFYLSRPAARPKDYVPDAFSAALAEAVARVVSTARQQYGPGTAAFDCRALTTLHAGHPSVSGSAD